LTSSLQLCPGFHSSKIFKVLYIYFVHATKNAGSV
jgi:hypothetical protein